MVFSAIRAVKTIEAAIAFFIVLFVEKCYTILVPRDLQVLLQDREQLPNEGGLAYGKKG